MTLLRSGGPAFHVYVPAEANSLGKRLTSWSSVSSSLTPCSTQSAAMCASWSTLPLTPGLIHNGHHHLGMPLGFGKKDEGWRCQDLGEVVQRNLERNGRGEDTRMRDHSKKFVYARPRNWPGDRSLGQFRQEAPRGTVVRGGNNLGVRQDVGVDGLHAQRPSIKSKSLSRSSRSTPGRSLAFQPRSLSLRVRFGFCWTSACRRSSLATS